MPKSYWRNFLDKCYIDRGFPFQSDLIAAQQLLNNRIANTFKRFRIGKGQSVPSKQAKKKNKQYRSHDIKSSVYIFFKGGR